MGRATMDRPATYAASRGAAQMVAEIGDGLGEVTMPPAIAGPAAVARFGRGRSVARTASFLVASMLAGCNGATAPEADGGTADGATAPEGEGGTADAGTYDACTPRRECSMGPPAVGCGAEQTCACSTGYAHNGGGAYEACICVPIRPTSW